MASGTPWLLATLPMTSMRRWISTFARSAWSSSFSWPFSCSFWALSPVISVWRVRFAAQAWYPSAAISSAITTKTPVSAWVRRLALSPTPRERWWEPPRARCGPRALPVGAG